MHSEKMNFPLNPQIRMMEGVVGRGNPPPSLVAPPSPGSVSKTSLGYDFAKDMGIAIVSGVTGVITFLVTKLWKYIKAKRNTPTDAAPSSGQEAIDHSVSSCFPQRIISPPCPTEHYGTPPTSPSHLFP
jgi:hypothetical protein